MQNTKENRQNFEDFIMFFALKHIKIPFFYQINQENIPSFHQKMPFYLLKMHRRKGQRGQKLANKRKILWILADNQRFQQNLQHWREIHEPFDCFRPCNQQQP